MKFRQNNRDVMLWKMRGYVGGCVCVLAEKEIEREREACERGMFPVGFNN